MTHVLKESAKRTLSARELSILRLVAQGKDMRAIADELGLAYGTLCSYGGRIRQKLGVERRARIRRRNIEEMFANLSGNGHLEEALYMAWHAEAGRKRAQYWDAKETPSEIARLRKRWAKNTQARRVLLKTLCPEAHRVKLDERRERRRAKALAAGRQPLVKPLRFGVARVP